MKLMTMSDLEDQAALLRAVVYGEPGVGKTWFLASGSLDEETSPTLYIEYRAQIASLRSNEKYLKALEEKRLVILSLDSYGELSYIYQWLDRKGGQRQLDEIMGGVMPKTVVIDSLTELQRSEVMRRAGNPEGKFLVDVAAPEIRDWGSLLNQFTLLANLFYQLPYHVVFGGLESVDYGEHAVGETPPIEGYRMALQGQAKRQFPAYALTLLRLERAPRNSKAFNVAHTRSVKMATKDQTGMLPEKILNPTIPKIAKMLGGEK